MRRLKLLCLVSALGLGLALGSARQARAQEGGGVSMVPPGEVTTGKLQFRRYCASCHGMDGKGDGPVAPALTKKPADLTVLTKNNNGEFPEKRVEGFINGSEMVAAHGSRAMPVWGLAFRTPRARGGIQAQRTEQEVNQRIKLIVDYIKSIQEK